MFLHRTSKIRKLLMASELFGKGFESLPGSAYDSTWLVECIFELSGKVTCWMLLSIRRYILILEWVFKVSQVSKK